MEETKTGHRRSVSQLQTYSSCSYEYYLSRVLQIPQRQAFWFIQGTSVHAAVEAYEKSGRTLSLEEATDVFEAAWEIETAEAESLQPDPRMWMFGRGKTKESDAEQRWHLGSRQVEEYIDHHPLIGADRYPLEIIPGELAVEVDFEIKIGGVRVVGKIDCIEVDEHGNVFVTDVKTGSKKPADPYQMVTYKLVAEEIFGLSVAGGGWWMCKDARYEPMENLHDFTKDEVVEWYHNLDYGIGNKIFLANPGDCFTCPVKPYCKYGSKNPLDISSYLHESACG